MTCRLNTTSFINLSVSILNFRKSSVWTILFIFIHTDIVSVSTNPRPFGAARAVSLSHRSELLNKGCWCGWTVKDAVRLHHRAVFTSSSHQSCLSSLSFHLSFSFHLPPPFPLISSASLQRFPFVSFAFPSLLFCLILSLCLHVKQPGVCLVELQLFNSLYDTFILLLCVSKFN